jgi:lipid A 3-O-deacylase
MKKQIIPLRLACAALVLAANVCARAQEESRSSAEFGGVADMFERGRYELAVGGGVLFSPYIVSRNRPTFHYTFSHVQIGRMLTSVNDAGGFSGNVQAAADMFGSAIFKGPGSYMAGGTAWLRYNFVQPEWRVVPYAQAGAGITLTDIDRRIVGQTFNFNLDLGFGARYFIAPRWSVNLEYRFQHISNANLGRHNLGINSHGPVLSASRFF